MVRSMENKNCPWVFRKDANGEEAATGVIRIVLAYSDSIMAVENKFKKGATGASHCHSHTQISYILSGKFQFTIGEETRIVETGDSLLMLSGVMHGCICLGSGAVLDVFTPMREDFLFSPDQK
jgi:quercetin dioxygenase-like cupin family protein